MTIRPPLIGRKPPIRFIPAVTQGRLVGPDKQFAAAGQFKTYDWPLPRQCPYPHQNRTHIQTLNLLLRGQDKQFGAAGQFKTYDWPLPRTIAQGKTWLYSLNQTTLAPSLQAPFNQDEWPTRVAPRFIPAFTQGRVLGPDTFFGPPGLAPVYNWPLPRIEPQGNSWNVSLNQTTLAPSFDTPFSQDDWPLPRAAFYPQTNRTWLDQLKLNLIGQDQFFAAQGQGPTYDWSLPKTALTSGKTWVYVLNQTILAPTIEAPFSQNDWPIPKTAPYPTQTRTWLDQLKLNLVGQDQFFGDSGQAPTYDWPLPRTTIRLQDYTWANNLSQSTLAPFIEPLPFNLYDWPTPRWSMPLVDLRSFIAGFAMLDEIPPAPPPVPPVILVDSGIKHHKPIVIKLREVEKREDLAVFLKAQIKLRHPASAFEDIEVDPAQLEAQAQREAAMRVEAEAKAESERLLSEEKERTRRITDTNNRILSMILASYLEDD